MTTTVDLRPAPLLARTIGLAALGALGAAGVTAIGTFTAGNDNGDTGGYPMVLGIIAVTTVLVQTLVVRTAPRGDATRRGFVLAVVAFLSGFVFWTGLPLVLAAAALTCLLLARERAGSFSPLAAAGLAVTVLSAVRAVVLAFVG